MGSAKETKASLDISVAAELPDARTSRQIDLDRIDHIVATLWKWSGSRAR